MNMSFKSPAFTQKGEIPSRYTCDGLNISPSLIWAGMPLATKSMCLIVDDPDAPDPAAPQQTWVHWLLYNIPAKAHGLTEGCTKKSLPPGTLEGINDWHRTGYGGPCPPVGRHRYYFKLYALDRMLPDLSNPNKAVLEKAIQAHVLEQCILVGFYQRQAAR